MAKCFKAGNSWVAEMPDEEWFDVPEDDRADFVLGLKAKARIEGCDSVAVFAIPDALFPMYGHTTKKRVYSEQLAVAGAQYSIHTSYSGEIPLDVWQNTPENMRGPLIRRVRDDMNKLGVERPGRYEIIVVMDRMLVEVVERGRV